MPADQPYNLGFVFQEIVGINFGSPRLKVSIRTIRTSNNSGNGCTAATLSVGAGLKLLDRNRRCVKAAIGGGQFTATYTENVLFSLPTKTSVFGVFIPQPASGELEREVSFFSYRNGPNRLSGTFPTPDDELGAFATNIPGTDQVTITPTTLQSGIKIWTFTYEFIPA